MKRGSPQTDFILFVVGFARGAVEVHSFFLLFPFICVILIAVALCWFYKYTPLSTPHDMTNKRCSPFSLSSPPPTHPRSLPLAPFLNAFSSAPPPPPLLPFIIYNTICLGLLLCWLASYTISTSSPPPPPFPPSPNRLQPPIPLPPGRVGDACADPLPAATALFLPAFCTVVGKDEDEEEEEEEAAVAAAAFPAAVPETPLPVNRRGLPLLIQAQHWNISDPLGNIWSAWSGHRTY